jgi:VCBS repeat-containing protein
MADINGTVGDDTLPGTTGDDVINGLGGNDTIIGDAGNDIINGGLGNDTMSGGDGDDTFVQDANLLGGAFYSFDGGAGIDTLELRVLPPSASLLQVFFTPGAALVSTFTSIERLHFASTAGSTVTAIFGFAQFAASGITEIVGGAGLDSINLQIVAAGTYTLSGFTVSNWSPAPLNAWDPAGDGIVIQASTGGNVTINAATGIDARQSLIGGGGNDILNGSDNADILNGGAGANQLDGGGGNDALAIINQSVFNGTQFPPPTTFNGAGSLFDGGDGTDALLIGGHVDFAGTLLDIEGVVLLPAQIPGTQGGLRRDAAVLEMGTAQLAMLPASAFFGGIGTVIANVANGASFNGSLYSFAPGSVVNFEIYAGAGDGVSLVGTSNGDLIKFGAGTQSAAGGGGGDLFQPGPGGAGTVTDFALGIDRVDLSPTGITGMERLGDFLSQGPTGARIAGDSGGVHYQLDLQGIAAASLTASDFRFDPGGRLVVQAGTALSDTLLGFGLGDQLFGGDGDDRIYTGGGQDAVNAGGGNDTAVIDGPIAGGSVFDGGAGTDTLLLRPSAIVFFGSEPIVTFAASTLTNFEAVQFDTEPGVRLFSIIRYGQMGGITTAIGGAGSDIFIVAANGLASNVYTIPTLNLVDWGADDVVSLSATGNTASVTLNSIAHSGLYVLAGSAHNDTLNGSSGDEFLSGRDGDDLIVSGGGNDIFDGGIGVDTAVFSGLRSDYTVAAGPNGSVQIGAASVANVEFFRFDNGRFTWNGAQLVPDNHPPVADPDTANVNEDATVTGNLLSNDSTGESDPLSADTISLVSVNGQAIASGLTIQGSYGVLTVGPDGAWSYVASADLLDAVQPGLTLSESFSYAIADSFGVSASSALTIHVTTVDDLVTVALGNGDDRFTGTGADEIVTGDRGDDTLSGLAGSDRLYGGNGEDMLFGGIGWDLLLGGNSADVLDGGEGADVLIGGRGDDILFGGLGADLFSFDSLRGERDRIGDFELGIDSIHLSGGISIVRSAEAGGSTTLSLSSGGSIVLTGVTGIDSAAELLAPALPSWTDGWLL